VLTKFTLKLLSLAIKASDFHCRHIENTLNPCHYCKSSRASIEITYGSCIHIVYTSRCVGALKPLISFPGDMFFAERNRKSTSLSLR